MVANGSDRIDDQLDVVEFIRGQMMLSTMHKTLFNHLERYMIKNQKKFVLQSREDESESSDTDLDEGKLMEKIEQSPYYFKLLKGTQTFNDKAENNESD